MMMMTPMLTSQASYLLTTDYPTSTVGHRLRSPPPDLTGHGSLSSPSRPNLTGCPSLSFPPPGLTGYGVRFPPPGLISQSDLGLVWKF